MSHSANAWSKGGAGGSWSRMTSWTPLWPQAGPPSPAPPRRWAVTARPGVTEDATSGQRRQPFPSGRLPAPRPGPGPAPAMPHPDSPAGPGWADRAKFYRRGHSRSPMFHAVPNSTPPAALRAALQRALPGPHHFRCRTVSAHRFKWFSLQSRSQPESTLFLGDTNTLKR